MNRQAINTAIKSIGAIRVAIKESSVHVVYVDGATATFATLTDMEYGHELDNHLLDCGYKNTNVGGKGIWVRQESNGLLSTLFIDAGKFLVVVPMGRKPDGYDCPYCDEVIPDAMDFVWHLENMHNGKNYPLPSEQAKFCLDNLYEVASLHPVLVGNTVIAVGIRNQYQVALFRKLVAIMQSSEPVFHTATQRVLVRAEKFGWVYRPSASQVEWTELGVKIYKSINRKDSL